MVKINPDGFDFSSLDLLLDRLWKFDLTPGFELMGNPSNFFHDFSSSEEVDMWHKLIRSMVSRYISRYGLTWVQKWKFETWNEPDHKDFCNIDFTLSTYLKYFDASLSALKMTSQHLKLGGPGGSCRHPHFLKFCYGLLDHVENGINSFNSSIPPSLDFLSFHKKGNGSNIKVIVEEELKTIKEIQKLFPKLQRIPVVNDESDPLKGWWRPEPWRAEVEYPVFIAENIANHKTWYADHSQVPELELLSHDNAFLSYHPAHFTQRTLLARIQQYNNTYNNSLFICKPVYNYMILQSRIAGTWLDISEDDDSEDDVDDTGDGYTVLGSQVWGDNTYYTWAATILVTVGKNSSQELLKVRMKNLPLTVTNITYLTFTISNKFTRNPYRQWQQMGEPVSLSQDQIQTLVRASEIEHSQPKILKISSSKTKLSFTLPSPSIFCVQLCALNEHVPPPQPYWLQATTSFNSLLLLSWRFNSETSCLSSFLIQFSPMSPVSGFSDMNTRWVTSLSYLVMEPRQGWYRVVAQDISGNKGAPSISIRISL